MRVWFWSQLIAFQLLWFSAVIGGNEWLIIPLTLIALHFIFSPSRGGDWRVIPIALIGMSADAVLTWAGVFAFDSFPYWLGLLWIGFVLTLGHSMAWLRKIPVALLVPMGALAGTASYLAGWKLQAVDLPLGLTWSVVALSVLWACLLPALVRLDSKLRVSA